MIAVASGLFVAHGVFGELNIQPIKSDMKIEFNSASISSGRRVGAQVFTPSFKFAVPLSDELKVYTLVEPKLAANGQKVANGGNCVDLELGASYRLNDAFTLKFGYVCSRDDTRKLLCDRQGNPLLLNGSTLTDDVKRVIIEQHNLIQGYTEDDLGNKIAEANKAIGEVLSKADLGVKGKQVSHAFKVGIATNYLLRPEIGAKFDATKRKSSLKGKIGHTFDLAPIGITGFAIDMVGELGYVYMNRPSGIKHHDDYRSISVNKDKSYPLSDANFTDHCFNYLSSERGRKIDKKYFYVIMNTDLVYSLNKNAKVRAGVRFAHNNTKRQRNNVWFSTAVECSF